MDLKTVIFMGRSGCGKGTQAKLLLEELQKRDKREVFYLESGRLFRDYVKGSGYTNQKTKDILESGGRVNSFLGIWIWTNALIENMKDDIHVVLDGSPRAMHEAEILDTAISFYKRENPTVVYVNVSRKWSEERLLARHRNDDLTLGHIRNKLDWFENDVEGAIWWYRNQSKYKFFEINGEQPIEKVKEDIFARIFNGQD